MSDKNMWIAVCDAFGEGNWYLRADSILRVSWRKGEAWLHTADAAYKVVGEGLKSLRAWLDGQGVVDLRGEVKHG
ncbi:MAG: hypothetical protein H5T69_04155 [Chloroflexi bacterium]|nr:hypothetical protein [Chloroflexota bacterium]